MSNEYQHKEYAISIPMTEPETDEEFNKVLLMARMPDVVVSITPQTAKRFAHLLPEGFDATPQD